MKILARGIRAIFRPAAKKYLAKTTTIRDVANIVEDMFPKGVRPPGGMHKSDVALSMVLTRIERAGHKVYRDDPILNDIIRFELRAVHATESMNVNSRYNENIPKVITISGRR